MAFVVLAATAITTLLLTWVSPTSTVMLAAVSLASLLSAGHGLFSNRRRLFTFWTGVLMMTDTIAAALMALPIFVPYLCFGAGLAVIVTGGSMIRLANTIGPIVSPGGKNDAVFLDAAVRSLLKGLGYVAAVMVASFLFLIVSFNATLGTFPLTFVAICVLIILIALTILAAVRPSTQ
jgi:hypothetical protein